jgi:hypothetical protein
LDCDAASDALWAAKVAHIEATLRMNLPMDDTVAHALERFFTIPAQHTNLEVDVEPHLLRMAERLRT